MSLYKPSKLQAFLKEIGAKPKKSLSQNFLIDGNIVDKILKFADIQKDDHVLEIGPGPGVLTEALLNQGAHVIAVEKDRKFAAALHHLQNGKLIIIEGDALELSLPLKFPMKLVANLPYKITTPVLARFLPLREIFSTITVMVQKEFADRMLANSGSKDYGSFSVFTRFYSIPKFGFIVNPGCFYPRPKIRSAVIQLSLRIPPLIESDDFFEMTRKSFQQRRKMIRTSLKNTYDLSSIDHGLQRIGKGLQVRPEELSLDDFILLFQEIKKKSSIAKEEECS